MISARKICRSTPAAAGLALMLSACGGGDRWHSSEKAASAGTTAGGMQMLLRPICPISKGAIAKGESALIGTIASALLVSAVDVGLKSLGAALADAGSDKTAYFPAGKSYSFYSLPAATNDDGKVEPRNSVAVRVNPSAACLILYMQASPARDIEGWSTETNRAGFVAAGLKKVPKFYFEASLEISPDESHFRLVPQTLLYGENLFDGGWRSSRRDIVLTFDWMKPGGKPGESVVSDRLTFMQMSPNPTKIFLKDELEVDTMSYHPLPAIDGKSKTILESRQKSVEDYLGLTEPVDGALARRKAVVMKARDDYQEASWKPEVRRWEKTIRDGLREIDAREAELKTAALGVRIAKFKVADLVPMNLQVIVAETAEGSVLLKKMGEILSGATPAINTAASAAIKERFDPATRDKAEKDEIDATNRTELEILKTERAVSDAKLKLANLPADASAEQRAVAEADVRIAQFNANVAYQAAGRAIRYPDARP